METNSTAFVLTENQIAEHIGYSDVFTQVCDFFSRAVHEENFFRPMFRIDANGERADALAYHMQQSSICDLCGKWAGKESLRHKPVLFALEEFLIGNADAVPILQKISKTEIRRISLLNSGGAVSWKTEPPSETSNRETFVLQITFDCGDSEIAEIVKDIWNSEIRWSCDIFNAYKPQHVSHVYWRKRNTEASKPHRYASYVAVTKQISKKSDESRPASEEMSYLAEAGDAFKIFADKALENMFRYYGLLSSNSLNFERDSKETEKAKMDFRDGWSYPRMHQILKPEWLEWKRCLDRPPIVKPAIKRPSAWKHMYFRFGKIDKNMLRISSVISECLNHQLKAAPDSKIFDDDWMAFWASVQWERWHEWLGAIPAKPSDSIYPWLNTEFDVYKSYPFRKAGIRYLRDSSVRYLENFSAVLTEVVQKERQTRKSEIPASS